MNDFRKNMHVAYKRKIAEILMKYTKDVIDNINEFEKDHTIFIEKWVNRNCLPMGDFSKEDALKEIEEWQK